FKLDYTPQTIQQLEKGEFSTVDILILIWTTVKKLKDKASIILWSSFVLLLFWGFHGDMAILTSLFGEGWTETITFHLPWGKQLVSFIVGFLLVVVIPCLIIKFVFKEKLRDFGLGLPEKDQKQKAIGAFFSLLVITSVMVFFASFDKGMQHHYPLFTQRVDGEVVWTITRWWEFIVYEFIYLLFFITIEFAFRGYLLFGLHSIKINSQIEKRTQTPVLRFGIYSILIQMLAYTPWHYGKPVPEMIGTVIWGVCVAAIALRIKSIWPIIIPHWLYNILLDWLIWKEINKKILGILG
ncbi:MAG: CPBP family intramembrane metalloprotease, partial [candidate division KSB1 bacterium]|nr:CPBP family intramembrane metalloprotease [candidate division KSB1 bacterium]